MGSGDSSTSGPQAVVDGRIQDTGPTFPVPSQ
jgi:hypothetical protein